ncbi:MAG: cyclic nucleotide-binding domain-containing protein [Candidatus Peregrinibacteria bacterium]|nr:cyclic nucleotide-binding domain-containing protein [Candidatus Peregrinibacteria bacterium]MDZ4244729.1 cyclic nucleotide-binding domain-containing protein [Candidatus Gracilibacteria bacterium]
MNDYNTILPLLQKVPLFKDLNEEAHKEIIDKITMMYYPANYCIFSKGDTGDALYIVKSGKVRIFDDNANDIAVFGPFNFFGEMALFDDVPRMASVETLEDTEVVILKKEEFFKLVASNENIAHTLSKQYFLRAQVNAVRAEAEQRKNDQ